MTIEAILGLAKTVVETAVPALGVIAIAVFVYGVVLYISSAGSPEKEKQARGYITYGLMGIFVLVAFWALVAVLVNTFGLSDAPVDYPSPPTI